MFYTEYANQQRTMNKLKIIIIIFHKRRNGKDLMIQSLFWRSQKENPTHIMVYIYSMYKIIFKTAIYGKRLHLFSKDTKPLCIRADGGDNIWNTIS